MKRILTTVVALAAVLSIGTVANAALYTYDVSGANGSVVTLSSFARRAPAFRRTAGLALLHQPALGG
jgi:hypothetical protein